MDMIQPIKPVSAQNQVYEELLKSILTGRIPPGEKITIEGMAKILGVSLTPVRVAIQKLEAGGFLVIGRNRRITVNSLSSRNLEEIMEVRLLNECYAAEKACLSGIDESVFRLLEEQNERCNRAESSDAYISANQEFHMMIYRQAGMPMLLELITGLWHRVSPYLYILLKDEVQYRSGSFADNHRGMLDAISKKDSEKIRYWLTSDLTIATDRISQIIERMSGDDELGREQS